MLVGLQLSAKESSHCIVNGGSGIPDLRTHIIRQTLLTANGQMREMPAAERFRSWLGFRKTQVTHTGCRLAAGKPNGFKSYRQTPLSRYFVRNEFFNRTSDSYLNDACIFRKGSLCPVFHISKNPLFQALYHIKFCFSIAQGCFAIIFINN